MKYIFRGNVVFEYIPQHKQMLAPALVEDDSIIAFNFCRFVPEDYKLISEFFRDAYLHSTGLLHESSLKDVDVT